MLVQSRLTRSHLARTRVCLATQTHRHSQARTLCAQLVTTLYNYRRAQNAAQGDLKGPPPVGAFPDPGRPCRSRAERACTAAAGELAGLANEAT